MQDGKFIVIEGVDGAGKTTQITRIKERLEAEGKRVYITCEPTCKSKTHRPSAVGGMIGEVLLGKCEMAPSAFAALFLCDRILHNTDPEIGIRAAVERGEYVICDRYYYSSFAYQGKDTDIDWVIAQNLGCPDIMRPDICIFLDLDPEAAKKRRDTRAETVEIFERSEEVACSVRDTFHRVFGMLDDNIRIINADAAIDEVTDRIMNEIKSI